MAYKVNGNVVIDDDGNGIFENYPLILTPTILIPEEGGVVNLGSNVEITATAFSGIYKTFISSQLQIANTSTFEAGNIVYDSGVVTPGSNVMDGGVHYGNLFARIRYFSSDNVISEYSNVRSFTGEVPPTVLGQSFNGGYYTGVIDIGGGTCYYLVVAPNATGCACCQWRLSNAATPGTDSQVNGYTNTYPPLESSTFPAGYFTATRTIGGYTDWYMPAINELSLMYTNKASMPAGEGYNESSSFRYFSSTQSAGNNNNVCEVDFSNGSVGATVDKNRTCNFRAVRRVTVG